MTIPFIKLHGAKNDFLITPAAEVPIVDPQQLAIAICDRYTGIGADGWMIFDRSGAYGNEPGNTAAEYDAAIRLFNSDGSEPELSGNGTRCAALLLARSHPERSAFRIWTAAGVKELRLVSAAGREYLFEMNMGEARVTETRATVQGREAAIVNVGNPQCVFPVTDFEFDWRAVGAAAERDPKFPNRTNVSFITPLDRHTLAARFWERGAGETNSSGTGSTGAALAARALGLVDSPVTVMTPAGPLTVRIEKGVWLTGPAEYVAEGNFHYGRNRDE
jgi:diaminopimelate epimerase